MIRNALIVLLLGAVTMTATACNTVKGLGRDIESVGRAGEEAID
ncbi:Entericidin EcnA/B family protein [Erythrobacter longus]|uniref:Entericidin EcnA/B family protein n=1 Tax=Erythrobacter longus TaxID=1044 RepID=A0A074MZ10_ERYLO|nr:entericidin A/B family lipoprotein [Erythrobacter longus]KEO90892.1 Entericidin EcnA/B family protein [Erythrobacter longus]